MQLHSYPLTNPPPGEVILRLKQEGFRCEIVKAEYGEDMISTFVLQEKHLAPFDIEEHPWCFVLFFNYTRRSEEYAQARQLCPEVYLTNGTVLAVDQDKVLPENFVEQMIPSRYSRPILPQVVSSVFSLTRGRLYEPLTRAQHSWELHTVWDRTPHCDKRLLGDLSRPGWYAAEEPLGQTSPSYMLFDSAEHLCEKCGRMSSPVLLVQLRKVCKECLPSFLSDVQRGMDEFVRRLR